MPGVPSAGYRALHWLLGGGAGGSKRLQAISSIAGKALGGAQAAGRFAKNPTVMSIGGQALLPVALGLTGYYGTRGGAGVPDVGLGEDFQNQYQEYLAKSRGLGLGGFGLGGLAGWHLGSKVISPLLGKRLGLVGGLLGAAGGALLGKSMGGHVLDKSNPFYDQKAQAVRASRPRPSWMLGTPIEQIPGQWASRKFRGITTNDVDTFDPYNVPMRMGSDYSATS